MNIVIRAGGIGTRLWPMSRIQNPKQFQAIVGNKSMLRTTYERVTPLIVPAADIFITVNRMHADKVRQEIPEMNPQHIIVEPETRNTGPAICLEVCFLEQVCDRSTVVASIASDDYIADREAFRDLLSISEQFIVEHPAYVLTPAVKPSYPDTGYSYFRAGRNLQPSGEEAIYEIADVVEKPNQEYLRELMDAGVYYCHTGMYVWQLGTVVELFKKYQPSMYQTCSTIVSRMKQGEDTRHLHELYSQLERVTIESALTDKIEKLAMSVSNTIGWCDLGKWHVVKRILEEHGQSNVTQGTVIADKATNNLLVSTQKKKLMVAHDIHDLVVVDTEDALLISSLKGSADVKEITDEIRQRSMSDYL